MINTNNDEHSFVKDEESGAVINTDTKELETYKLQRLRSFKEKKLADKVAKLEKDMREIKKILVDIKSRLQ